MQNDSTFFEEAVKLCNDANPHVSRIAESLYQCMLTNNQEKNLSPIGSFNILYFFQVVIRLWFSQHTTIELGQTNYPYPCESICGCIWPSNESGRNCMVEGFIEIVRSDSVPEGSDFDVTYATEIIALVFDNNGELRELPFSLEPSEQDFDYWLSGFNTDQT
ncbi:hypothetical protein [Rubinisphaera italica]|uniref:Uncharacterized protein n=1 Tax=Rubinisphaera italica TaxID=2527969 RepID=A0A5C5XG66_9PLAN|nr:hypothetical protein [Rubinisphaera italica]TWT61738.1 hypothetical protein Pan54_24750 [Rubinisphaera italica]